jgi:hypothetical protein
MSKKIDPKEWDERGRWDKSESTVRRRVKGKLFDHIIYLN